MIKSTQTSIRFTNSNKLLELEKFIDEYRVLTKFFVDYLWNLKDIPKLIPIEITNKATTWLSARAIQACAKQASGIVRGTQMKQKKRLKQIEKFTKLGMHKKAKVLQKIYDEVNITKPSVNNVNPELDSRFVKIDLENGTSFDGWLTLTCLGNKLKLEIPFKKTLHFNKMLKSGTIKTGVRISKDLITFMFEIEDKKLKTDGKVVGLDIGIKSVYSLSTGEQSGQDIHGWDLDKIIKKMCRKVKGSKAFEKCQKHRKNHINWCLNQIDFSDIKVLNVEKIQNLRRGKKTSKYLSRWTYSDLTNKLTSLASSSGVQMKKLSPTYTSQRCSHCGWTRKANRKGKKFVCSACGNACDADMNASLNISFDLPEITLGERLKRSNRTGFYWNADWKEPIVSSVQKAI